MPLDSNWKIPTVSPLREDLEHFRVIERQIVQIDLRVGIVLADHPLGVIDARSASAARGSPS